jgi:hypothetical protein
MKQSKRPLWKKSMLEALDYGSITDWLYEIQENGDTRGYGGGDEGYYQEYKNLFDDLAGGAGMLLDALDESNAREFWDDMTVALLGQTQKVLGFDAVEEDYFGMLDCEEDWAVQEAEKRLERMTKAELIRNFRTVLITLVSFFDLKAAHDCLTSIVQELDEKGALLEQKNEKINQIYGDLTGKNGEQFDDLIANLPQRMWVE